MSRQAMIWADVRLRAAWARGDWGAVLREYRRAAGISQHQLSALIATPQSYVSLLERGRRHVTELAIAARITEGLSVPADLRGLPPQTGETNWAPDPDILARIARAHTVMRADTRITDYMSHVLAELRREEDRIDGEEMWAVVRAQLDRVTRILPTASGTAADRLMVLAAEHAHWLSWVAAQHEEHGAALGWLDIAYGWAIDAGSADMLSWLTRVRSRYTLLAGDPVRALRTAEASQQAPRPLSPAAASIAAHQVALAAAQLGERDRSRRAADLAYELALQVPAAEERPAWLYWLDPTRAVLLRGEAAYAAHDWATARDAYAEGLPGLEGYPRDHAFYAEQLVGAAARA